MGKGSGQETWEYAVMKAQGKGFRAKGEGQGVGF